MSLVHGANGGSDALGHPNSNRGPEPTGAGGSLTYRGAGRPRGQRGAERADGSRVKIVQKVQMVQMIQMVQIPVRVGDGVSPHCHSGTQRFL